MLVLILPYTACRRNFGANTIWYLQFHRGCDKLSVLSFGIAWPLGLLWALTGSLSLMYSKRLFCATYHGPSFPYYQPPEEPSPMVTESAHTSMETSEADVETASETKSSAQKLAVLSPKFKKGTSKKKSREVPSKDAVHTDSSE